MHCNIDAILYNIILFKYPNPNVSGALIKKQTVKQIYTI